MKIKEERYAEYENRITFNNTEKLIKIRLTMDGMTTKEVQKMQNALDEFTNNMMEICN